MRTMIAGLACLLISACAAGATEQGKVSTPASSSDPNACPVTVPPQPGFVPPEPYPTEPPFDQVWYGTAQLWTILDSNGDVWRDLPVGKDGSVGDKTLWFSERFSTAEDEDFTGNADIALTAERLDGPAHKVVATRRGSLPADGGVPSPQFHEWALIAPPGSDDDVPSTFTDNPFVVTVNEATGGWFAGGGGVVTFRASY